MNTAHVVYRPEVANDLTSAFDWYESQRPGLGDEFLAEIQKSIEQIQEDPVSPARLRGNVRAIVTRRFPYVIYYVTQTTRILVLGILHGHRDPSIWKSRVADEKL